MAMDFGTTGYRVERREEPAISVYLRSTEGGKFQKISCSYCKRTIYGLKGQIDKMIDIPMPVTDFGIAINIMCKVCHQQYRLLVIDMVQG